MSARTLLNLLVREVAQAAVEAAADELRGNDLTRPSGVVLGLRKHQIAGDIAQITEQPDGSEFYTRVAAALHDLPDITADHVGMCLGYAASLRSSCLNGDFEWDEDDGELQTESKEWERLASILADIAGVDLIRPCEDLFHDDKTEGCRACLGTGTWPPMIPEAADA